MPDLPTDASPAANTPVSTAQTPPATQTDVNKGWPKWYIFILVAIIITVIGGWLYYFYSASQITSKLTSAEPINQTKAYLLSPGKLIIGTDATFRPMEYTDANGQLIGYDIDLGNRIAAKLDLEAEFQNIAWDDLFTSLEQGKIDIIISSVSITDERKVKYQFSDPYLNAGQVIITRNDDNTISSVADLTNKKIAVQSGTTNEEEAKKYTSSDKILVYDDFLLATKALLEGEADAIFSDLTAAKGIITDNPSLKISSEPFTSEYYGITMKKDNSLLHSKINDALGSLRQQGVLVLLKQKWLE